MTDHTEQSYSVESVRSVAEGRWLRLEELSCIDRHGRRHGWEAVERQNEGGVVLIIPRLQPSGCYVLIRQYRPPARSEVIEFPAGLVDPGETPEEAAVRELREETGYTGVVRRVTNPCPTSPGLTGEAAAVVTMDIDETLAVNAAPEPSFDAHEDIAVHVLAPGDVPAFLTRAQRDGASVDIKVATHFEGR